jgi:20S proteasome alpha/beta subunit
MTVCIGAICDDGHMIVVAADRMMTYGPPMNLQVEMTVRKIIGVTETVAMLFAGAVPDGEAVISRTKLKISGQRRTVQDIASAAVSSYQEIKMQKVEDTILRPLLGVTFPAFQTLVAQAPSSQILAQVLGMVAQHNMQLDLLVAGFDDDQAHLFAITNPGVMLPVDTIGSLAIGSGGLHANVRLSLGRQTRHLNFPETVYNVYEAKIAAEVAPGVGKMTDMAVLRQTRLCFFEDKDYETLSSIHQERPALGKNELDLLEKLCKEYADESPRP